MFGYIRSSLIKFFSQPFPSKTRIVWYTHSSTEFLHVTVSQITLKPKQISETLAATKLSTVAVAFSFSMTFGLRFVTTNLSNALIHVTYTLRLAIRTCTIICRLTWDCLWMSKSLAWYISLKVVQRSRPTNKGLL